MDHGRASTGIAHPTALWAAWTMKKDSPPLIGGLEPARPEKAKGAALASPRCAAPPGARLMLVLQEAAASWQMRALTR